MSEGRRQCQVLTQSEVLHFVGWLPYRTGEEFDQCRVEHPELQPFPPYDFRATGHTSEKGVEDGGGVPQGHSPYMDNLGYFCLFLTLLTPLQEWQWTLRRSATRPCWGGTGPRRRPSKRNNQLLPPPAGQSAKQPLLGLNNSNLNSNNNNNNINNNNNSHDNNNNNNNKPLSSSGSNPSSPNNKSRRLLLPFIRPGTLGRPPNLWRFWSHPRGRGRSSEPEGEVEMRGREYYLRPAQDALEAVFPPRFWVKLKGAPYEHHISHLESSIAAVSFEFALLFHGLLARLF